jgi:hypothetical protein
MTDAQNKEDMPPACAMVHVGPKQFYFTAAGFDAAMLKAVAHFKATPLVRLLASLPC